MTRSGPTRAVRRGGRLLIAWVVTLAFALPIYIAISSAFKTQRQILDSPLSLPAPFTFDNIVQALSRPDHLVQSGLLNSVLVTALSVGILIPLSSALAFYISERRPVTKGILLAVFALGLMVPPQVVLLPIIQLLHLVGLANSYPGLILSNVGGGYLSFAVFVYVGFLRTVPREVIEAARVDGASDLRIWWTIVLPLVRPATATVGIFLGLWIWNDFLNPLFILGPLQGQTITTGIYVSLGGYTTDFAQTFAIMFLAAIIPVVGYLVSQREFIHGLMWGVEMTALPEPPALDEFTGEWLERSELEHLHSLRNQWGQAHVNGDLTSISWLAMPPFVGGYHTGVLRIDGHVVPADRFSWAPWGVLREGSRDGIRVRTDTRMAFEHAAVLWKVDVRNDSNRRREVVVDQELLAPIAHSEVDWGWLYGTPWNAGHYHDYYATERIRREALADDPRQVQLMPHDSRIIRLGSPRLPGIQRDEDDEPMLMESSLPDHSTSDSGRVRAPAALGVVTNLEVRRRDGSVHRIAGVFQLTHPDDEVRLESTALGDAATVGFDFAATIPSGTGVIFTHGNHPDSLQFGVVDGRVWIALGGERVTAPEPVDGRTHRIEARVDADGAALDIDGREVARTVEWWRDRRWSASIDGGAVLVVDAASPADPAFGFATDPEELVADGQRASARWSAELEPGQTLTVAFRLEIGTDLDVVVEAARSGARNSDERFAGVADSWRRLWRNAFIPGNPDHSGYLPVLDTVSSGLARTYYFGILLALYLRNTGVSEIKPVFLTGGPRLGPTTTFYWDISEWPRTAALLEPRGLRAWIIAALAQPYDTSHSFDTRNLLPVGNHYASNDHALFRTVESYIAITGDTDLLDEMAGDRAVLDHLRSLAGRAVTRRAAFGQRVLVDLGRDPWELLECVPNYRDAVVSFNAGYVGMLRSLAALLRIRGLDAEAGAATVTADRLARAVLGQYAGGGRWRIGHPDGDDVIGHCLDFELVSAAMADDLTPEQRDEMVQFVTRHLIDGEWMHALDPDDPIAPFSDRPDHGAAGAFAGWPGSTSYGLARLGRADIAADFLSRVHASRSGALWGQAVEQVGGGHYRVAERGVSNRDSSAAVAVTEAVIAGLFGIRADFDTLEHAVGATVSEFGTLHGVRAVGFDLDSERIGIG